MVIRGVASSSRDGLRSEGPGTAVTLRKLKRRGQSLPHIFLGSSDQQDPKGSPGESQEGRGRAVTGFKVQGVITWRSGVMRSWGSSSHGAMEDPGMEGTWSHRVVWPWNHREAVRGRGESRAFLHQMQIPWRVGIVGCQQGCRVLKGSPCPQPQGKFQFSVCSLKEERNKPKQ